MGTRWHEPLCAVPDIAIDQCTKSPRCLSCNASPRLDELIVSIAGFSPLPPIPPDEEPGNLRLFWPASVPYTNRSQDSSLAGGQSNIREGETEPEVALVHQVGTSPIYVHPLLPNEFRLLHLTSPPGDDSDSLVHADLKTFSHDDCPEYETASYTWGGEEGDSTLCKPIFIGPYWDVLLQTKNCWALLKLMRPRSGQRVVWVDAICINQSSYTEREDQVAKMRRIYEDSLRVFVFLGDDIVHPVENASYPTRRKLSNLPRGSMYSDSSSTRENSLLTLDNVLKRMYFTRIWVVQELILSRQAIIRIGSTEYWADYHTSRDIKKKDQNWNWSSTAAPWFRHLAQRSLAREDRSALLDMMRLTWGCHSADPRDRVFGILGIAQADDSMLAVQPNYSISAQHMFIGIFAHCLINLRDTKVLSWASGIHGWDNYLSWAPAWQWPILLPKPVNLVLLKRWLLEWKREFVRQLEEAGRLVFGHKGYTNKYCLKEDFDDLKARDERDESEYSVVKFLPIVVDPERSDQQQIDIRLRGEEHYDNSPRMSTSVGASEENPWYATASVCAATGILSINLIHLLCIRCKPTLVSQIEGLKCYRVSSRPPRDASEPYLSETAEPKGLNSATVVPEKPEILKDCEPYLFFTTQTANLDNLIIAGEDHLFILDNGSSPPSS